MDSTHLLYFKAIAEAGNMSKAAKQLFISQPALSKSLTSLEKELGVPLFTRTNGRLTLNSDGSELLKYANEIDRTFHDIESYFSRRAAQSNPVTISSIDNNFSFFMKNYYSYDTKPIQLKVLPSDGIAEVLLSGDSDAIIADDSLIPSALQKNLRRIPLLKELLLLMVPKEHPLANQRSISIQRLGEYKFMYQSSMQWLSDVIRKNNVDLNLSWSVDNETWNYYWTHYHKDLPPCFVSSSSIYSHENLRTNMNMCSMVKVEGDYTQRILYLWYYESSEEKLNEFIQCVKLSFS